MNKALNITFIGWRKVETLNSLKEAVLTTYLKTKSSLTSLAVRSTFTLQNLIYRINLKVDPYKSLDEITAKTFHEIKYQNLVSKMDKNWTDKKRYTQKDIVNLNYYWTVLVDEYFELTKNQKLKNTFRKQKQKTALSLKIEFIDQFISIISYVVLNKDFYPKEHYDDFIEKISQNLSKLSHKLKKEGDVYDWINKLINYNNGLKTKYSLENKDEEEKEAEFSDFYKELAYIEMALEKDSISEDINMTKWIIYKNQVYDKINRHGK